MPDSLLEKLFQTATALDAALLAAIVALWGYFRSELVRERTERQAAQAAVTAMTEQFINTVHGVTDAIRQLTDHITRK